MSDHGLQGRLSDFTLEEILQLIALQQKTGLLRVEASYPMALYFEAGILISYRDRRQTGSDPLETYLKTYGFFAKESWEHIDFVQRHSQLDLADILVNEGLLDADELAGVQMEAAQEYLFNGMLLRDGRYQFVTGRNELNAIRGRVRMKVEGLLMESVRRIDEIPGLRKRFPSGHLKIRRTIEEIDLKTQSSAVRRVLAICEDECSVDDVTSQGRMSEFQTLETLEQLRHDGVITVQSLPKATREEKAREAKRVREEAAPSIAAPVGLALVSLLIGALLTMTQPARHYATRPTEGTARAEEISLERRMQRGRAALELYRLDHPGQRASFAKFQGAGLLTDADVAELQKIASLEVSSDGHSVLVPREDQGSDAR